MKDFITLLYSYVYDAEDKNPQEDNDDEEAEINFVIENNDQVKNEEPGESKLIKWKMKSKAIIIDDGT